MWNHWELGSKLILCYTNTRNSEKSGSLPLPPVAWVATTHVFLCGAALSCCPWEGMLVPRAGGGAPVPLLQSGVPGESPGEGDPSSLRRDLGTR